MVRLALLAASVLAGSLGLGGCGDAPITIAAVSADRLWEGLGCGTRGCEGACTAAGCPGGRRASLIHLRTEGRVASASAVIPGASVAITADVVAVSDSAAVLAVRIPVTTALAAGAHDLELRVVGEGGSVATTTVSVRGLDELVLAGPQAAPQPVYSRIVVPTAFVTRLEGSAALRFVATGDIELAGELFADASEAAPGPGGCAAAADASEPAPCPPGGGGSSLTGAGGGGGFGTAGGGGPLAGATTGTPLLVPVGVGVPTGQPTGTIVDDNRGHGGGAHAGDRGGHGGGAVVLVTRGRMVLGEYARVTARGGAPATTTGPSGGGGSGGALVIGAHAGFEITPANLLPFEATGGGSGAVRGGDGRIRLDSPDELAGFTGAAPRPWLGPAWLDVPLVALAAADLTLRIDARATEPVVVHAGALSTTCVPAGGLCRVRLELPAGITEVCAILRADYPSSLAENATCVDVARL